jgi:hypothetical protein
MAFRFLGLATVVPEGIDMAKKLIRFANLIDYISLKRAYASVSCPSEGDCTR